MNKITKNSSRWLYLNNDSIRIIHITESIDTAEEKDISEPGLIA